MLITLPIQHSSSGIFLRFWNIPPPQHSSELFFVGVVIHGYIVTISSNSLMINNDLNNHIDERFTVLLDS